MKKEKVNRLEFYLIHFVFEEGKNCSQIMWMASVCWVGGFNYRFDGFEKNSGGYDGLL